MDLGELDLSLLVLFIQPDCNGELLLWQVLLGILEVLRRELHGPVHFTIRNSDRVLSSELAAVAVDLEVGWGVCVLAHTIELDGGVLFAPDFAIFTQEFVEWDLVGDEGEEVAAPVSPTGPWRENPDFRSEAVLARNEACPCPAVVVILLNHLDVDRLRLRVAHGCDGVVLALASRKRNESAL